MNQASPAASYRLEKLTRTFPGIVAVDNVDLEVRQGEIHGIIGKNGAGKSVLVSTIAGVLRPTSGSLVIRGSAVDGERYSPAVARDLGVSLIPQEPQFALTLSVQDNIFMGIPMTRRLGLVRSADMAERVREMTEQLSLDVHPNQKMDELPLEDQQLLAFGKALFVMRSKVVLLDEITASLTRQRKTLLLNFLLDTVKQVPDLSFTLISHHIHEIIEFCHRVTVMRDGQAVATLNVADTSAAELAAMIVGSVTKTIAPPAEAPARSSHVESNGRAIVRVRGLSRYGRYQDVDFALAAGEVIGLAGLDGCGKDEIMEALAGLLPPDAGEMFLRETPVRFASPREAFKRGIAYLPKKREEQAVVQNRSVEENALLSIYPRLRSPLGLIDYRRGRDLVLDHIRELNIKTPGPHQLINYLSGGNRQKVILSRVISKAPVLYVLNEPTRGVDLSVKPEILSIIRNRLAPAGGVVMTSESEEELIETCDRILVLYRGRIHRELRRNESHFNPQEVYRVTQGL